MRKDVGELAGVSLPTVDRWLGRYANLGLAGLEEDKRTAREQLPAHVPARILARTRTTPPMVTGLSHWSSREMAAYVTRTDGVPVPWHYVAKLFAALDVATGTVLADCYRQRTGADLLAFLRKAVKPHAGKEIHVVLDNLSTHDTPEVQAWREANPNVTFHFTR